MTLHSKILVYLFFIPFITLGQQEDKEALINELGLFINKTALNHSSSQVGYGLGAYHTFDLPNKSCIKLGLEYTRLSRLPGIGEENTYSFERDVKYDLNFFSIPVLYRMTFGEKVKIVLESGLVANIGVGSRKRAIEEYFIPFGDLDVIVKNDPVTPAPFFSPAIGLGFQIPMGEYSLIAKPEYRYGLTRHWMKHELRFGCTLVLPK